ncbi:hypothetical protein [Herbidospora daliensis]|uniref:hypothetical protein n=1 Tax=Herbidospora daliensis TaxID=295585 RepID=UPI00078451A5|nr:hypothetical protein [Herbidospora daliensis]
MKSKIAGIGVAVLASVVVVPLPAQAAAPNPVVAVKRLLAQKRTAKVVEWGTVMLGGRGRKINSMMHLFDYHFERKGWLQLGPAGVVGSHLTRKVMFKRDGTLAIAKEDAAGGDLQAKSLLAQTSLHRSVAANGRHYSAGRLYSPGLPKGRPWAYRGKAVSGGAFSDQIVNIFEPTTLQRLLSDTYEKKYISGPVFIDPLGRSQTNLYSWRGKLTFADLYAVSPTFRALAQAKPDESYGPALVWWDLLTDRAGVPVRFNIMWDTAYQGYYSLKERAEGSTITDFVGWRSGLPVKPPHSTTVAALPAPAAGLPEFDDVMEVIRGRRPR